MKKVFTLPFALIVSVSLFAQTQLTGTITDFKGEPIAGANIYIRDSYDGTSSDINGRFSFATSEEDSQKLVVSYIGYETYEQAIYLKKSPQVFKIILKEIVNELNTVVITAGSFEASDERRITILRPLDIVTTAGAAGDTYGALQTLPGTQQIGNQTGLFVRGGDASEAKTFIDGVAVADPFFTGVPDIPQRGRFSPFLFKGTYFSTGGYSAQYGNAMSSALVLESQDLPDRSTTNIALMSVGVGIGHNHRWKNTSVGVFANYINLEPYNAIVKQNYDWRKAPEASNGSVIFRQKMSKTGMLKAFISYAPGHSIINFTNPNDSVSFPYDIKNKNLFSTASFKEKFAKNWTFFTSTSYSRNETNINTGSFSVKSINSLLQARITLSRPIGDLSVLRFGSEVQNPVYSTIYSGNVADSKMSDVYVSGYAEADIYISPKLVARLGVRPEYSSNLKNGNLAPRISLAYKTGVYSQVSFAYGQFYQQSPVMYVQNYFSTLLFPVDFSHADHYILNYQVISDKRTFRVEAYYKTYLHLIKLSPPLYSDSVTDNGSGYARGFDFFWRDKKTIPFADYWISYSFLDTKRNYLDYPYEAVPPFAAKHTLSIVYKQTIPTVNINIGFTYVFATGRTYYNPNNPLFLSDKMPDYNNFSLNASWLTTIFKNFTVIAVSANNVFGFKHVYDYRYSSDGSNKVTVSDPAKRSFFIGLFMSIGEDRGDD